VMCIRLKHASFTEAFSAALSQQRKFI